MNNRAAYRNIRSLAELRMEREKIRWQLRSSEDVLQREYRYVCSLFTFANITRTIFSKIENIQALITGVREGYSSIAGLFQRRKHDDK